MLFLNLNKKIKNYDIYKNTMIATSIMLFFIFTVLLATFLIPSRDTAASKTDWQKLPEDSGYIRIISSYIEKPNKFSVNEHNNIAIAVHFRLQNDWKMFVADKFDKDTFPQIKIHNKENVKNFEVAYRNPIFLNEYKDIVPDTAGFYRDNAVIIIKIEPKNINKVLQTKIGIDYSLCREGCISNYDEFDLNIKSGYYNKEAIDFVRKNLPRHVKSDFIGHNVTIYISILAFFGGLLLNIMPCVLPVLSIKIFSIVNYSSREKNMIRLGLLFSSLGIIVSFLLLGELLIGLKLAGKSVGWGFYLQNPKVLIFGMIMIAIFISSLLGYFQIKLGSGISNAIEGSITKVEKKAFGLRKNYLHLFGDFLSGAFTTLLATPCSAPLLGTAITFALTRSNPEIFAIFASMGLGMSLPYLILSIFPKAIKMLPKPGGWMRVFEMMLAFILFVMMLWVGHILHHDIGSLTAFYIVLLCLFIIWQFKFIKNELWSVVILIVASVVIALVPLKMAEEQIEIDQADLSLWMPFNESLIDDYVSNGKTVVIEIGADWCLSCKVNRVLVFRNKEVLKVLKQPNIVAMRGDITKPNPELMEFMKGMGRHAIPFVAVFGPNVPYGKTCPELIKKKKLLNTIEEASRIRNPNIETIDKTKPVPDNSM